MRGLLLKDLMNLRSQGKIYLLLIALWGALSIKDGSPEFFSGLMLTFALLVPMSAMAYDEKAKWDGYALTMPFNDADMVLSRYFLGVLCSLLGFVLTLVLGAVLHKLDAELLVSAAALSSMGLVLLAVMLPLLFRFGTEKARLIILAIVFIPMLALSLFGSQIEAAASAFNKVNITSLAVFAPLAALALLALSAALSVKIYKRKEF